MATIDEKEILEHSGDKLHMRIRIDGKDYFRKAGNSKSTDPADQQATLDRVAETVRQSVEDDNTRNASEDLKAGVGDWAARPEGPEKQRIAQHAMRDVIRLARQGKDLQANGKTRPEAAEKYMSTRRLKDKIWDELTGNHVDKARYLGLGDPGDGTPYGELRKYMDDLGNAAPDWNAIVTFMRDCNNPIEPND